MKCVSAIGRCSGCSFFAPLLDAVRVRLSLFCTLIHPLPRESTGMMWVPTTYMWNKLPTA